MSHFALCFSISTASSSSRRRESMGRVRSSLLLLCALPDMPPSLFRKLHHPGSRSEAVMGELLLYSDSLFLKKIMHWGAWVSQSVGRLTSVQVMISRFVSSSPASGSVLTARSLEPVQILCLPLSLPLPCSCSASLCLKNK